MIKGLHTSASGMLPQLKKQEITSSNVANAGATGFKEDRLFTKELSIAELKQIKTKSDWGKPMVTSTFVDYTSGVFDQTGNPLDLDIDGDGFITIRLQDGPTALTRTGDSIKVKNKSSNKIIIARVIDEIAVAVTP